MCVRVCMRVVECHAYHCADVRNNITDVCYRCTLNRYVHVEHYPVQDVLKKRLKSSVSLKCHTNLMNGQGISLEIRRHLLVFV